MIKISARKIERLVDQLSVSAKIKLLNRLEQQTLKQRWNGILKEIDRRLQKFPITPQDVTEEIQSRRKEKHAQGRP